MHVLQSRAPNLVFEPWWRDVHARPGLRGTVTLLNSVNPPGSPYFPDFLTPFDEYGDLGSGIETVLRTPVRRLRNELVLLAEHRKLPTWVGALAEGRATALNRLGGWLREYHEQAIGPYEARIGRALAAHRAACARTLVTGGWDAVFAGLAPSMRWAAPVLEVDYPVDRDLVLAGRGLLLVPSFFCWRTPVMLADPELPPVLVYPIPHAPPWLGNPDPAGERAVPAALLGVTRTAVLEALPAHGQPSPQETPGGRAHPRHPGGQPGLAFLDRLGPRAPRRGTVTTHFGNGPRRAMWATLVSLERHKTDAVRGNHDDLGDRRDRQCRSSCRRSLAAGGDGRAGDLPRSGVARPAGGG